MATRTRMEREIREQLERSYGLRLDELYAKLSAFRETSESQQAEITTLTQRLTEARSVARWLWKAHSPIYEQIAAQSKYPWLSDADGRLDE